jgi:hypothetical protein
LVKKGESLRKLISEQQEFLPYCVFGGHWARSLACRGCPIKEQKRSWHTGYRMTDKSKPESWIVACLGCSDTHGSERVGFGTL